MRSAGGVAAAVSDGTESDGGGGIGGGGGGIGGDGDDEYPYPDAILISTHIPRTREGVVTLELVPSSS